MIRLLEELSLNALPALQTVFYDGWVLRFANGYSRRANSVQPLYASTLDLDAKIDQCEAMYRERGLTSTFKLTGAAQPDQLDFALEQRGYATDGHTSVQTRILMDENFETDRAVVEIETSLGEDWLQEYARLSSVDPRHVPTIRLILASLAPTTGFFRLLQNGETAAIGLGVLERGYIGLYDIVTDARHRSRGLGTQVIHHILRWGQTNGAHSAYLQVMLDNAPAVRLYNKLGFHEVYQYWYRRKG
jgi:ribosomal protein S18 acetylase RimI-like enzyme